MRVSYRIVYGYIAKEFFFSFLIAFSFFFIIFFINQILVMAEQIFSKHVPFNDVILLLFYSMPIFIAFSFPFGSLVGALMAVGRFSSDNEILAFQASGISFFRLMVPMLIIGIIFSLLSFVTNDYFLPAGNIKLVKLYTKILHSNPAVELEPYSIRKYGDAIIVTGGVKGSTINNMTLIDRRSGKGNRVIVAKNTTLSKENKQKGVVALEMKDVFLIDRDRNNSDSYSYSTARELIYNILLKDISISFGSTGPAEMSSFDVWQVIKKKKAQLEVKKQNKQLELEKLSFEICSGIGEILDVRNTTDISNKIRSLQITFRRYKGKRESKVRDRELQYYRIEFNKKFAIPVACLLFMIFGFPVGMLVKRSGRAIGFGIGFIVSFLYWGILFLGQNFGARLYFSPVLSIWMADIVVIVFAIIFLIRRARR